MPNNENQGADLPHIFRVLTLAVLALIFFFGTASFNYYTQRGGFIKWLSPDETANYYFSKLYAEEGKLSSLEPMNVFSSDIIHPRSFRSDAGTLKPMSFLGMTLIYGKIGSVISARAIPYLTPFFGALGIILFYFLIKEIFGPSIALISAGLLTFFPPYFYYASRSMFHNVLFVVLATAAAYFSVLMTKRDRIISVSSADDAELRRRAAVAKFKNFLPRFIYPALAGTAFGLAAVTRTSELLWLAPVFILAWLFKLKRVGLVRLVVFLAFVGLAVTPALYWNRELYGAAIDTGYPQMNASLASLAATGSSMASATLAGNFVKLKALAKTFYQTIFFFGFDFRQSAKMLYRYFFAMFPVLFWGAVTGLAIFFVEVKRIKGKQFAFLFLWLVTSAILLFYYGSWEFHDNPDPRAATIGNSYTRYWLPIYLGAIPWLALAIVKVTRLAGIGIIVLASRIYLVAVFAVLSLLFVLYGSDEGLVPSALKLVAARAEAAKVLALTPENSVIITKYHDKYLFPERRVIYGLFDDDRMNMEYARLVNWLPLYYYNFTFPVRDINYLNNSKLAKAGLKIEMVAPIEKGLSLYRLQARPATTTPAVSPKQSVKER